MSMPEWTLEMIYLPAQIAKDDCPMPSQAFRTLPAHLRNGGASRWQFTDQYMAALENETEWRWIETPEMCIELHLKDKNVKTLIIRDTRNCPVCHGSLRAHLPIVGQVTGLRCQEEFVCPCIKIRVIEEQLRDVRLISPKHAHACLETMKPDRRSLLSEECQQTYIDLLRARPRANYLFWGDSATGKTYFVTALVQNSIVKVTEWGEENNQHEHRAVFRTPLIELLDQMHAQATRDWKDESPVVKPVVEIEVLRKLIRKGYPVTVVLEELDKFVPTEARLNNLFKLVDAIYEGGAQLVLTSNLGPEDLLAKWGEVQGQTILRRICDWSQDGGREGFILHFKACRKITLQSTDAAKVLERIRWQAQ